LESRCVPTTIIPTTFADGGLGSGSLRDAVLQFNADTGTADDIIQLEDGTYSLTIRNTHGHENAGLEGDLNMNQTSHRWIIQGAGSATIIDASQLQDRVFQIVNPGTQVVLQDLVIQGGLAQDDGTDGALPGTTDALGGGILNNGGDVRFDNVVIQHNVTQGGAGASYGTAGHNARGGGIYSDGGALTMAGATVANNQANGGRGNGAGKGGLGEGGGLYATGGSLDISNSRVASNRARGGDGGDGTVTRDGNGTGGGPGGNAQGAGLFVNGGSLTISTASIASNQASGGSAGFGGDGRDGAGLGGGLYNAGTLTVRESTLSGNSAYFGGGINNSGTLTLSNITLTDSFGNGILNSGTLSVSNSTLSGNFGGGIYNPSGTLMLSSCCLSGNSAAVGGAVANFGKLTVNNSTLSGNSAYFDGGGIYTSGTSPVTLTNVTVTANRANTGGGSVPRGGGVFVDSGSPVLHCTLIAGNFNGATGTTPDDVVGRLDPNGDYNLIGDGTGMTGLQNGVNGNLVGSADAPIDSRLGPLQDNGGPTQTMAVLPGSLALNAGNPNQLGVPD
jgi:hypothetical protein